MGEIEQEQDVPRGWESLAEWTGSIRPEHVEVLREARALEGVYPLLHALVGRNLRDFFVRAAALQSLVADGRAAFSQRDLAEVLYWLDDAARDATLRSLRSSGWLEFDPSAGTTISPEGRWAYDVLSFLHKKLRETELAPTVAGVEYALQIGVDPLLHLQSLRSRLNALRQDMEAARSSHSEVVLLRAVGKHREAVELSGKIRAVLLAYLIRLPSGPPYGVQSMFNHSKIFLACPEVVTCKSIYAAASDPRAGSAHRSAKARRDIHNRQQIIPKRLCVSRRGA